MSKKNDRRENGGEKKEMDRRQFLKVIGATAVTASWVGFPHAVRGAEPREILFGHIHPMSGALAESGRQIKRGLDLAIEEVNGSGGIRALGGAQLKLLTGDSEGKPEIGISEAEKLIRAGVVAVTGCYQSSVAFATTQVAEKYHVAHIIESGISDEVIERGFKYTFRITPGAATAVRRTLQYVKEFMEEFRLNFKTAVHFHEPSMFGVSISQLLTQHISDIGIKLIGEIKYNLPATDLTTDIIKVKSLDPDILFSTSYYPDGILGLKGMKQFRVSPRMVAGIFNGAFGNANLIKEIGKDANFVFEVEQAPNMKLETTQRMSRRFKEKYNVDFDFRASMGMLAVYLFKDALERAKSYDREAVKEAIRTANLEAPFVQNKPVRFDEKGDNINSDIPMTQVLSEKIVVVKPNPWGEARAVLPFPKWEERK
jgi:branched-chain amino acid transport system substrate-binding protein